jgi:hypothetical protein
VLEVMNLTTTHFSDLHQHQTMRTNTSMQVSYLKNNPHLCNELLSKRASGDLLLLARLHAANHQTNQPKSNCYNLTTTHDSAPSQHQDMTKHRTSANSCSVTTTAL